MKMKRPYWSFGLVGFPLEHSWSPRLHRAALAALGLDGAYELLPVSSELFEHSIGHLLSALRTRQMHGLNVTIPYKSRVVHYLDDIVEEARWVGAVNTIVMEGDRLLGYNTDVPGFFADLQRLGWLNEEGADNKVALVFGAGGAARAVVYTLLRAGFHIQLVARRPEQAWEVRNHLLTCATDFGKKMDVLDWSLRELRGALQDVALIVNCTPLGMWPHTQSCPWPEALPLPKGARVYDLVYRPRKTALLQLAERSGNAFANGLGMLIEQAALSLELWIRRKVPREAMWQEVQGGMDS